MMHESLDEDALPFLEKLTELQEALEIEFGDPLPLLRALTHDSYYRESSPPWGSNERLEFLGDSVLGMVISHLLYRKYPESPEGVLAHMKAYLVSTEFLSSIAKKLGLGHFVILGRGEELTGGRERPSVLTDAYEALLGAVYIDRGLEMAEKLITSHFIDAFDEVPDVRKNSKSLLQEHTQKYYKSLPLYSVVKEEGPPHQKTFFVRVNFRGEVLGEGSGASKKEAEKVAAEMALNYMKSYLDSGLSGSDGNVKEEE
ncbi:MAG: ribonuclease III [Candidatus Eremiobacteraeota bacterium]|nr:ribonuclease III [Candidatus Eremiobacteraeota bacterium]